MGGVLEESRTLACEREFPFSDDDFDNIRQLVSRHTGISLSDAKRDMVYGRLARRLRSLGLDDFKQYCRLLEEGDSEDELGRFTNAVTTNLTAFFREPHHFDFLGRQLLPELVRRRAAERRLRIWSAGCSTGEEPYSIAMQLLENLPQRSGWDIKVLATDLDTNVLATARRGIYAQERLKNVDQRRQRRWFRRGRGDNAGLLQVKPELQQMITFKQLNLMLDWPMQGLFDIIFCRNVIIYFDKPTQSVLMERFSGQMADHGRLFLGHSETLYRVTERFKLMGQTIYEKAL